MRYIVYIDSVDVAFDDANTAISYAEISANHGKQVLIKIEPAEEESEKTVFCPDCSCYKSYVNANGRLIQMCEAHDIEVSGDFYCAWGELNKRED
jgi:hypothetical protein